MTAKFPTSVATDADLSVAVNSLQTTLSAGINSAVTSIPLTSTTGFPTAGYVTIDNEVIQYTGVSGGNLTGATRGADGSSAAAHLSAAAVSATIVAAHHNAVKDEVEAVESWLDTVIGKATTVTSSVFAYLVGVTSAIQTQINAVVTTAGAALPKGGGTMSGPIAMGSQKVTGLASGTAGGDAVAFGQAFTSGSHTFSPTTAGIIGTTTSDNAAAGTVGESISSVVATWASAGTSGQWADATSLALTAGDWDVSLLLVAQKNGATVTVAQFGIGTVTGNTAPPNFGSQYSALTFSGVADTNNATGVIPALRVSLASPTTYYAKLRMDYSVATAQFACRFCARRMR